MMDLRQRPGHLGIVITHVSESEIRAELQVNDTVMAPNGFLHAATVTFPLGTQQITVEAPQPERFLSALAASGL